MLRWAKNKLPEGLADVSNVEGHLGRMSADPVARKVPPTRG
jgi:hypothetical protein